ncbi:MAG: starch-binding protein [Paludibacteraceae bacterium]|nr:starch-binding protein [Paludibacteraceae bacterium]
MFAAEPVTVKSTFTKATKPADNKVTDLEGVVTWNIATTVGAGEPTYAVGAASSVEAIKFGASKSVYYSKVEFSTDYYKDYNVTSVSLYVKNNGAKVGTLTAKQGEVTIGSKANAAATSDWNVLTASGETGAGGSLVVSYEVEQASYISYIEVTYEEGGGTPDPEPTTQTLYLKLSSDWAGWPAKYAAYYFDNETNGWSAFMSEVEGETNIYTTTIPVDYSSVIFARFNSEATAPAWDSNKWSQTVNLTVPTDGKNLFTVTSGGTGSECDGTWSVYTPSAPAEDITFYLINNQEWTAPTAYVFAGSTAEAAWPGKAMTKTDNKVNGFEVYSYTFKDNFTSIIFNDGKAEGTTQTVDLAWDKAKPYFVPGSPNGEGKLEGTWYATMEEIPAPPTPVYNIAGAWTSWALVELAVAEDGKTATYEVELPKGEYEFKIVRTLGEEKTWLTKENDGAYGLHRDYTGVAGVTSTANNNLKLTADENGIYLFTWTFENDSVNIKFPAKHALNETWSVGENTAVAAGTVYADNYAINIKSVYATTLQKNARTFGGFAFTHAIQVRNAAYPSADALAGTEQSGSTSLVVTANEDVDITLYYNRQSPNSDGKGEQNDGKDLKVFDQAAPTTALEGTFKILEASADNKYINVTKLLSLKKGQVYTLSAKGTTIQLSGIRYASDAVEPVAKFYITGNDALVGAELAWNAKAIKSTEDTYTITGLKANTAYCLKVIEDGDWDGGKVYGYSNLSEKAEGLGKDNDDNITFKLAEDGDVTVTYYWQEVATDDWQMVFKLTGNFYVAPKKDLFLVPNQWADGDAKIAAWVWDKDGKMDSYFTDFFAPKAENNDTLVVKVVAEADSIIFVRFNKDATEPKWNGGDGYQWNQTPNEGIDWEKAVFTILPGTEYYTDGTWDVYTPEPAAKFYITGNAALVGDELAWQPNAIKSMEDSYKLSLKADVDYMLKLTLNGTWVGENNVLGYDALTEKADGLTRGTGANDDNICFKLTEDGDVTVTYKVVDEVVTFKLEGKFYVAPAPVLADGFYLIGKIGGVEGWDAAGLKAEHKFTPNLDNTAEFMLNVTLAEGDQIQVVNVLSDAITAWFPGGEGNNFIVTAAYAGQKTIYFRPDNQGGEGWHHGCIYIAPNPETGLGNLSVDGKAVKAVIDGQLFIRRDGKTYTIQGWEVR